MDFLILTEAEDKIISFEMDRCPISFKLKVFFHLLLVRNKGDKLLSCKKKNNIFCRYQRKQCLKIHTF